MFYLTFKLIVLSVLIATVLGVAGASAASIANQMGRWGRLSARFFLLAMIAALAMPMILHAAAWEAAAGKFGWLPLTQTGARTAFRGLFACGWIHGLAGAAMVGLATWFGTRTAPISILQQAQLELTPAGVWWRIKIRYALPWIMTAVLGTALLASTEMTVADLYGYRTVADQFYLYYSTNPTTASLIQTCALPVALGILCFSVQRFICRQPVATRTEFSKNQPLESSPRPLAIAASLFAIAISLMLVAVPFLGLLIKLGHHVDLVDGERIARWSIKQCADNLVMAPGRFAKAYFWTTILFVSTGILSLAIGWTCAAFARKGSRRAFVLDSISLGLFLLPGPVVGLAVVSFFTLPIEGFRDLYHRSLVPTIIALLFRAGPVAYWIMRAGYRGVDESILNASSLELDRWRRFWLVHRPLLIRSAVTAWLAAGMVASGDVPATLPVVPADVTTVGTRLFGLLHSGARFEEAALASWYISAILLLTVAWAGVTGNSRVRMD